MTLVKFNNGTKASVNPFFNDVLNNLLNDRAIGERSVSRVPAVNIAENETGFAVELAAPGLKKEDFKISLDKDILTVSAEKKTEDNAETKKFTKREYSYYLFTRSFTLPESADQSKIEADYTDGILTLSIAKKEEAKYQSREISIK